MFEASFRTHLEERFNFKIKTIQSLAGGDINEVKLLTVDNDHFVIKINAKSKFPDLLQKEANGLKAIRTTGAIDVPEVFGYGDFGNSTYLLMEYIQQGTENSNFWQIFGQQLAQLHQNSRASFGFYEDNYIGSLKQYNSEEENSAEFYIQQRLKPQFDMAKNNGFVFNRLDIFFEQVSNLIPNEPPALIHGDLWCGNYLANSHNQPCLIDPTVAFAPREMDIAMMKLFGGFDDKLFDAYHEVYPLQAGGDNRVSLWQLYYILAHLNLFGGHYYNRAKAIIQFYS